MRCFYLTHSFPNKETNSKETTPSSVANTPMSPFPYPLTAVVTVMVLATNIRSGVGVGTARDKYEIKMPKTTGPPGFERAFRAHANNAEQTPLFLAMSWLFAAVSESDRVAAGLGLLWVILRNLYVTEYQEGKGDVRKFTIPAYLVLQCYAVGTLGTLVYQNFLA